MHQAERKKLDLKKYIWFHLHEILEKAKLINSERKQISGCLGLLVERDSLEKEHTRELFGCLKCFYILIVVFPSVHQFVKIHQALGIKCMHFIKSKLYLKKVDFLKD